MQPTQQNTNLSNKAFYLGGGSVAIVILEVAALAYGISDGSSLFVVPLLVSPLLAIAGIVVGVAALKQKKKPRGLAILGIICGTACVVLFVGFFAFAIALASALQGIY